MQRPHRPHHILAISTAFAVLASLAGQSAAQADVTDWQCITFPNFAIRENTTSQDVQCLSYDGLNCQQPDPTCAMAITKSRAAAAKPVKPVTCGEYHLMYYNITGYDTPGHFCQVGRILWPLRNQGDPATVTPWECLIGSTWPYAIRENTTTQDIECLSYDGKNCSAFGNDMCPRTILESTGRAITPLACGAQHLSIFGGTGYSTPGHWCDLARQLHPLLGLGNPATVTNYRCLPGWDIPARLNTTTGTLECLSYDGVKCESMPGNCPSLIDQIVGRFTRNIMCTPAQIQNVSHWCYIANQVLLPVSAAPAAASPATAPATTGGAFTRATMSTATGPTATGTPVTNNPPLDKAAAVVPNNMMVAVGAAVGGLAVIAIITGAVFYWRRKKRVQELEDRFQYRPDAKPHLQPSRLPSHEWPSPTQQHSPGHGRLPSQDWNSARTSPTQQQGQGQQFALPPGFGTASQPETAFGSTSSKKSSPKSRSINSSKTLQSSVRSVNEPHWFFLRVAGGMGLAHEISVPVSIAQPFQVCQGYDPQTQDEVTLFVGNLVVVKEIFRDGWAIGFNKDTNEYGALPLDCLYLGEQPPVHTGYIRRLESRSEDVATSIYSVRHQSQRMSSRRPLSPGQGQGQQSRRMGPQSFGYSMALAADVRGPVEASRRQRLV
ncbi:hypothetical protein M427DRAFT_27311 [Gonapodya prolifera JEL478]|uniref:SH3 domain-containing protein n=1 Tax=Gonapodya prolifera (strain JEL478) TaxID=1344416 RepID=A0A139AYF3_GONPJ|nr:hypothetical protein M427DRAFT_27311 [Gonapodya prolifera JEL478]|eukprot:KXS21727.1 hypothetical protein M427DRAFT_27311 [Gonapodya prolifera JEL478]